TAPIVEAVAEVFARHPRLPLVIDPVSLSKHGHPLLSDEALEALRRVLLPRATIVTPNLPEAAALLGLLGADALGDPHDAADALAELAAGPAGAPTIVLKGGHREGSPASADLVRLPDGRRV